MTLHISKFLVILWKVMVKQGGYKMEKAHDPRQHFNEEPRDDLKDLLVGFGGMAGFMVVIFLVAIIVKAIIG